MLVINTIGPKEAPTSPRRLAEAALAAGYHVVVAESYDPKNPKAKAWGVLGSKGGKRFQAFWASTEAGGCKAVGQVVDDGKGTRPLKSRELTAWVAA